MKRLVTVIGLSVLCAIAATSCKKDSPDKWAGGDDFTGPWKFSGLTYKAKSTIDKTEFGRTFQSISTAEYTSTNNAGTIHIEADTIIVTGLAYDAAAVIAQNDYENGELKESTETHMSYYIPATDLVRYYHAVGEDSVHLPEGLFVPVRNNRLDGLPSTCSVQSDGRTMTVKQEYDLSSHTTAEGQEVTLRDEVEISCVFQRP